VKAFRLHFTAVWRLVTYLYNSLTQITRRKKKKLQALKKKVSKSGVLHAAPESQKWHNNAGLW